MFDDVTVIEYSHYAAVPVMLLLALPYAQISSEHSTVSSNVPKLIAGILCYAYLW
jgi:hypothetical protein